METYKSLKQEFLKLLHRYKEVSSTERSGKEEDELITRMNYMDGQVKEFDKAIARIHR